MTVNGNEIGTTRERSVYRGFRNSGSPLREVPLYLLLLVINSVYMCDTVNLLLSTHLVSTLFVSVYYPPCSLSTLLLLIPASLIEINFCS